MQINPKDTLAGYPILEIRKLLKHTYSIGFNAAFVSSVLKISEHASTNLIKELVANGFIEEYQSSWQNTLNGNALAKATAAKPIKRETAERKLTEFLERVKRVNTDEHFLYRVTKVVLFGSYLSEKKNLGDIDLAIGYAAKELNKDKFRKICNERIEEAKQNGRYFSTDIDELFWPTQEVKLFLKARSRSISLGDIEDGILLDCENKVIYEYTPSPS